KKERPILIQASLGLGRVVLVGFDLDLAPFTEWPGQKAFWIKLMTELVPQLLAAPVPQNVQFNPRSGLVSDRPPELTNDLQRSLEPFDALPVFSFAWVALFILIYILIVGPLDYFLLKRFFKRLELTWITFPLIAIVVSVLAYLIAYNSKGS